MKKRTSKKVTTVRTHARHVPASVKNPEGITIVDRHLRRLPGTYLDPGEIESIFSKYDRKGLIFPKPVSLDFKDGNRYDEVIAIWTDYFNKKFNANPPLDPDAVKALIAGESGFKAEDPRNKVAFGIMQITRETLKTIQDPKGEAKEFIFNKIRLKDLKTPEIAIPMGVRWIFRKREKLTRKLGRVPIAEELAMEYKGLFTSQTSYKKNALKNFREHYGKLKAK